MISTYRGLAMGVFEKASEIGTREAFLKARIKSRKESTGEIEEIRAYILSDRCVRDIDRLREGDYFLDFPRYRLIPKNFQDKKRAIYIFDGEQGQLIRLLAYAIRGLEDTIFSDRLFSFRSDKSAKDLLHEVVENKEIGNMYILKSDVSNYVGSIVPALIIPMLEDIFMPDDPAFFRFLEWLLSRNMVRNVDGKLIEHCPGGLGGVALGNLFMNIYLHEMDEYFAPRAAFYSRYSDDILICARTYDEIKEYERRFHGFLDKLKLSTNNEKTMIVLPGEAFDFLGMEICGSRIRISEHSMLKIKRKLRLFTYRALRRRNNGEISPDEAARELISGFNRSFFGNRGSKHGMTWARWAFPVITDTSSLEEIDHYFQDSIRYVLYGSMKKRNRRISYEKLSELGYRSLVYYYYHLDEIEGIA